MYLTREGVVTTNYVLNLRDYLDQHQTDIWQNDVTGVYLAGALKLLHKDKEAEDLIAAYKIGEASGREYDDFCQPLGANAQYIAILARAFPERLKKISGGEFEQVLQPIGRGRIQHALGRLRCFGAEIVLAHDRAKAAPAQHYRNSP